MNKGSQEVKMQVKNEQGETETRVVGTANYFIYETVSEAVDHLGEEKLLDTLNAQVRTNEMNRVRGEARGGPGKKALEDKAIASFTGEDWASVAGDKDKIRAMIDRRVAELRSQAEASVGSPVGAGAADET